MALVIGRGVVIRGIDEWVHTKAWRREPERYEALGVVDVPAGFFVGLNRLTLYRDRTTGGTVVMDDSAPFDGRTSEPPELFRRRLFGVYLGKGRSLPESGELDFGRYGLRAD